MKTLFTEHPQSVGETYFQHMGTSVSFGFRMLGGGLACLVHGIFPFLCTTRGSDTIKALHTCMIDHRHRDRAQWTGSDDTFTSTQGAAE